MRWLSVLLVGLLCAASCTGSGTRSPVFTWGTSEYIQPGPSSRRVSYQVFNCDNSLHTKLLLYNETAVGVHSPVYNWC